MGASEKQSISLSMLPLKLIKISNQKKQTSQARYTHTVAKDTNVNEPQTSIDLRPCPYCCEPIKIQAVYCRWCKRSFKTGEWKKFALVFIGIAATVAGSTWAYDQYQEYKVDAERNEKVEAILEESRMAEEGAVICARQEDLVIEARKPFRKTLERKFGKYYGTAHRMEIYGVRRIAGPYWPQIVGTVYNAGERDVVGSDIVCETYDADERVLEQPDDATGVDTLGTQKARKFKINCMNSPGIKSFKITLVRGMQLTQDGEKSRWGDYDPNKKKIE